MNDLGIRLAWLAVQVTLLIVPALALIALASRRGPASGSWVATLSLGLVIVLSVAGLIATPVRERVEPRKPIVRAPNAQVAASATPRDGVEADRAAPMSGIAWNFSDLRNAWNRLDRTAVAPAARVRPWGRILAVFALCGMSFGLVRLLGGLGAVAVCRRRGRVIDDPEMTGLRDRLRGEMGCRRAVEMREVSDLTTPATAGWRRPVVLLPSNWCEWSGDERRAVLAHELAHVVRGDYASGLVARIAVVLNSYHPLVRWLAHWLDAQQEQAADALAARFAGGGPCYLTALARLALKQDGRSPRWPAREFLADRGTLIRRIAMLRDQSETEAFDRPSSRVGRLLASLTLIGLTIGVATLHGPARADGDDAPAAVVATKTSKPSVHEPIVPVYVPDGAAGLIAIRPASLFHRIGMGDGFMVTVSELVGFDLLELDKQLQVDTTKPGYLKLGFDDVEWAMSGIRFNKVHDKRKGDLHSLALCSLTVRTFAPFDYLAFLRQWPVELIEVRMGDRAFYQIKGEVQPMLGPQPCLCLLDDRTLVLDDEPGIRALISGGKTAQPAFVRCPDWNQASRGLLAVALNNQNEVFKKQYDLGRPDDAIVLSLFKGVDHWMLGIDDADSIAIQLAAAVASRDAGESILQLFAPLIKQAYDAVDRSKPSKTTPEHDKRMRLMLSALLKNLRLQTSENRVVIRTNDFGTFADFASMTEAGVIEAKANWEKQVAAGRKAESEKK